MERSGFGEADGERSPVRVENKMAESNTHTHLKVSQYSVSDVSPLRLLFHI